MSVTAYSKVAQVLRRQLLSGQLAGGARLPTERDLCERFGASRITIRRALSILEEERLIERRQGAGTFGRTIPRRKIPLLNTEGFSGSIVRHAPDLSRKVLKWHWIDADVKCAEELDICRGDKLLYAVRSDWLGDVPVACDSLWLVEPYADRLTEQDLEQVHFLAHWQAVQSFQLHYSRQTVEAERASALVRRLLSIRRGSPVLKEHDLVFAHGGQAVGLFISWYRHDVFRFDSVVSLDQHPKGIVDD
jgi:DNA-binding GntR family transcriptional regulator